MIWFYHNILVTIWYCCRFCPKYEEKFVVFFKLPSAALTYIDFSPPHLILLFLLSYYIVLSYNWFDQKLPCQQKFDCNTWKMICDLVIILEKLHSSNQCLLTFDKKTCQNQLKPTVYWELIFNMVCSPACVGWVGHVALPPDAAGERGSGSCGGLSRSSPPTHWPTYPTAAALSKCSTDGWTTHSLPQQGQTDHVM